MCFNYDKKIFEIGVNKLLFCEVLIGNYCCLRVIEGFRNVIKCKFFVVYGFCIIFVVWN